MLSTRSVFHCTAVLSLLCDNGDRYLNTYHDAAWVQAQFGDCSTAQARLSALMG